MQALALVLLLLFPTLGHAQSLQPKGKNPPEKTEKSQPVPRQYLPPRGMCRIWIDNVPATRQPAPTDCPTAIRNRPPNGRVIFPAARDERSNRPKSPAENRRPDTAAKRKPPT
jgi:hypothetical protein